MRLNETTHNNLGANTGRKACEKTRKSKNSFSSHFTFTILSKLHQGFRPSQIADQLGVTPQDIYYHTDKMIKLISYTRIQVMVLNGSLQKRVHLF